MQRLDTIACTLRGRRRLGSDGENQCGWDSQDGEDHKCDGASQPGSRIGGSRRQAEDMADTAEGGMSAARQAQRQGRLPGGQTGRGRVFQSGCVCEPLPGGLHGQLIAAELSLGSQAVGEPPDGWMVEQQRLNDPLGQIDPEIEPPNVRHLMGDDGFQHFRRHMSHCGRGQQHHGTQIAQGHRFHRPAGEKHAGEARQAQPFAQHVDPRGEFFRQRLQVATPPVDADESEQQTNTQDNHPANPAHQNPGQRCLHRVLEPFLQRHVLCSADGHGVFVGWLW